MASKNKEAAAVDILSKQLSSEKQHFQASLLKMPSEKDTFSLEFHRIPLLSILLEYSSTALHLGVYTPGCYRFRRGETGGGKANSRRILRATSTLFWAISKALFTSSKA